LYLNETLTEAIALGHDLGHTPFGHAGEAVLDEIHPGGFQHNKQSLRVVDVLEKNGRGLNLTAEVRDGILKHSKGRDEILPENPELLPETMEGRVVRISDIIAYISHDLDDALRGGIIVKEDIPRECSEILGTSHSERINTMVKDLIFSTLETKEMEIRMHDRIYKAMITLRDFLYERVYGVHKVHGDFIRAKKIIMELYQRLNEDDAIFEKEIGAIPPGSTRTQTVCDFIAGMTDRYALHLYEKIFLPKPWAIF